MNKLIKYFSSPRRSTRDISVNILIIVALTVIFTLINPNFIGGYNLVSMGQNLTPYTILSLGILFPVALGGIDLSVGATCIGSAVVAGTLYKAGMPLGCVIPVMILFGLIVGLINGAIISKYKIQPFIVTLGSMMFVRGITAIFAAEPIVVYPSNCWYNYLFSNFNGFPMGIIWVLFFALIVYFVFRKTKYGRYFISIGSNEKSTQISGVNVDKYKCLGYVISGVMAGIAGIFWSSSFATLAVATGNGMELDAVAGVYIGGTSALGGMANVWGSVVGAIMLVVVRSGLNFSLAKLNININSTYITFVISGLIVVIAVLIERMRDDSLSKKKKSGSSSATRSAIIKLICIALTVIMLIFLVLSGTNVINLHGGSANEEKTICLLMKSEGNDFWNLVKKGAEDAGAENGYTIICRGPETEDPSELPKQLEIAESLLSKKPVGIVMATLADGFGEYMKKLYDSGICAIEYDSGLHSNDRALLEGSGTNPLRSYVKANNFANAEIAAEHAFEAIRKDIINSKNYVIGIIQHENTPTAEQRAKGFETKIKELIEADPQTTGKAEVITEVKPSQNDNAYKAGLEFLYEKGAKTVYATSLISMYQVYDAIQAAGDKYDGIKFVGYDSSDKLHNWIKSDSKAELIGVVDQNPYMLGKLSVETIVKISKGEKVESEIIVPGVWYDKNNIK